MQNGNGEKRKQDKEKANKILGENIHSDSTQRNVPSLDVIAQIVNPGKFSAEQLRAMQLPKWREEHNTKLTPSYFSDLNIK